MVSIASCERDHQGEIGYERLLTRGTHSRGSDASATMYFDEICAAPQLLAHGFEHLWDAVADAADCMAMSSSAAGTPDVTMAT